MKEHGQGRFQLTRQAIRRSIAFSLLSGAAAVAALLTLVRDGDEAVFSHLRMVDARWLWFAAGLTLTAWLLRTWRSQLLARAFGTRIPARRVLRYYLASVFVSHVTPTSTGGVPVFIYLLAREGLSVGRATAVAVVDSGLVVLWLLAAWPVAAAWKGLGGRFGAPGLTAFVLVSLGMLAALVAWTLVRPRAIASIFMRMLTRARRAARAGRRRRMRAILAVLVKESLRFSYGIRYLLLQRPWHLVGATLLTGVYWLFYLSIAWAVLVGLGARMNWLYAATAQLIFNLFQPFIPTPGGSGGAELIMAYLFKRVLPASRLAVFVGVWRFFTFYASLVAGGIMFVRSVGGALREAPAHPSPATSAGSPGPSPALPGPAGGSGRQAPAPAEPQS
ncbi:MAG: flippase-like domain-containing protein [Bacillota bacterium]